MRILRFYLLIFIHFRLPEDIYQTAKVSKILILMDKGNASDFHGKMLKDIDINPEVEFADDDEKEIDLALPNLPNTTSVTSSKPNDSSIQKSR